MQRRENSTAVALRDRFSKTEELLVYFSYHNLRDRRKQRGLTTLKDCVRQPFASLQDIAVAFEPESAVLVAKVFVTNLNDNLNINRMEPGQVFECAELIFEEYPQIKLTELHEFFRRVKSAYYGEYYGSIDCVKLMSDFREFIKDRNEAVKRLQAEHDKIIMQKRENERARQMSAGELLSREEWEELRWLFNLGYENIRIAT